jgi:hypothetical protein
VETFVYEIMNDHESTGLLGDIVNSWISCVNFHEIADHLNEDLEG